MGSPYRFDSVRRFCCAVTAVCGVACSKCIADTFLRNATNTNFGTTPRMQLTLRNKPRSPRVHISSRVFRSVRKIRVSPQPVSPREGIDRALSRGPSRAHTAIRCGDRARQLTFHASRATNTFLYPPRALLVSPILLLYKEPTARVNTPLDVFSSYGSVVKTVHTSRRLSMHTTLLYDVR